MEPRAIEDLLMPVTYGRHLARLFPPAQLFAGTGLDLAALDGAETRISVRQALRYIENARRLAHEPDWYLAWAATLSDHFHGPISVALMSAPSLGDGVDAFMRYFPHRVPYLHLEARTDGDNFELTLSPLIDLGESRHVLIETPFIILLRYLTSVYDIDPTRMRLTFAYPPPAWADRYTRHFPCAVQFGARKHTLSLPSGWRALGNLAYLESTWTHALAQCEATLSSSRERTTLGEIRGVLNEHFEASRLQRPVPTLAEVALGLHLAPRTLIRRLRRLGTTYQAVVNDVLRGRAVELLGNDALKVKEVAAALGFSNPANFGKAFKRWFGTSPGDYRYRQLGRPEVDRRSRLRVQRGCAAHAEAVAKETSHVPEMLR